MCIAVCPKLGQSNCLKQDAANDANNIGRLKRDAPQTGSVLSTLPQLPEIAASHCRLLAWVMFAEASYVGSCEVRHRKLQPEKKLHT